VFVVDTNVLLYAVNARSPFHGLCRDRLEQWRSQASAWFLTWPILYEFLRVSTHPSVLQHPFSLPQAWAFAAALLKSPALTILVPGAHHSEVAEEVFAELPDLYANVVHDAATAILMREHGIRRIDSRYRLPPVSVPGSRRRSPLIRRVTLLVGLELERIPPVAAPSCGNYKVTEALRALENIGAVRKEGEPNREGTLYRVLIPDEIGACRKFRAERIAAEPMEEQKAG